MAQRTVIALLPRYLLEVIAFSGIISVMIFFVSTGYTTAEILPIVSLYAMAGFRLLPAVQQVYSGITIFKFNLPALENLYSDCSNCPTTIVFPIGSICTKHTFALNKIKIHRLKNFI